MMTKLPVQIAGIFALAFLCMSAGANAAEKNAQETDSVPAVIGEKATPAAADGKSAEAAAPSEYSCKYYTVTLPDDWKAVLPPAEKHGMTNATFAKVTGAPVVTMIVGARGVADARTIATMFAEQFKAEKAPVEKNGQYTFSFTQLDKPCQAWIATEGDIFMLTSITGNRKEALNFIKRNIKSQDYTRLLPQQ